MMKINKFVKKHKEELKTMNYEGNNIQRDINIIRGSIMVLFNRKSPEERRLDKFNKVENSVHNTITYMVSCPLWKLYELSVKEEEYLKTCYHFNEWFFRAVFPKLPNKTNWASDDSWYTFKSDCICGLLSLMITNQYEEVFMYCNKILEFEHIILESRILRGHAGGIIGFAHIIASEAKLTGNKKQRIFINEVKLLKAVSLYELGRYNEAYNLLITLPELFGLTYSKKDDYFNQNFKYKNILFVQDILELIDEAQNRGRNITSTDKKVVSVGDITFKIPRGYEEVDTNVKSLVNAKAGSTSKTFENKNKNKTFVINILKSESINLDKSKYNNTTINGVNGIFKREKGVSSFIFPYNNKVIIIASNKYVFNEIIDIDDIN